jgi:hypothetical protein
VIDAACNARMRNGTFSLRVCKESGSAAITHADRCAAARPEFSSFVRFATAQEKSTSRESRPRFATKDCQARTPSGLQHFLLSKAAISDDARRICLPVAPVHRRTGSLDGTKHGDRSPGQ